MNQRIYILLLLFFALYFSESAKAQLINVESNRMQEDTTSFAGLVAASFSYQQNNNATLLQTSGASSIQARSKSRKDVYLLLASYDFAKTNSGDLNNAGFGHFRYTHKFNNFFRMEGFVQYQVNPVLLLDNRSLFGTGPRFKILNKPKLKSSLGTMYMFELENTLEQIPNHYANHRLSTYFTFNYVFADDKIEFSTITYYQPLFNNFNDFRFNNQTSLSISVIKNLSLEFGISYLYDSSPPSGVIGNSFSSKMGVKASF